MPSVYDIHPETKQPLTRFCIVPKSQSVKLEPLLENGADPYTAILNSWKAAAAADAVVAEDDKIVFQIFGGSDPSRILCGIMRPPRNESDRPWILVHAGLDRYDELAGVALDEAPEGFTARPRPRHTNSHVQGTTVATPAPAPAPTPAGPQVVGAQQPAPQAEGPHVFGEQQGAPARVPAPTPTMRGQAKTYKLIDWAYAPLRYRVLPDLAARALPEVWGYGEGDMSILYSYVVQTFNKLMHEGKVYESANGDLAAFNTGLVTPSYDDLYLVFVPNGPDQPQRWRYQGVCTAGERGLGKQLVSTFAKLPPTAVYMRDIHDVVFDAEQLIHTDYQHIVVDNLDRIPTDFIALSFYDAPEMRELVQSITWDPDSPEGDNAFQGHADGENEEKYNQLRTFLEENPRYFNRIVNRMKDAEELARKRARWSFRTGVPSYYPRYDEIQLLLPLCLSEDNIPNMALAVSRNESGTYQGETILTLRMAYKNARLICRPESEWLMAN